MFLISGCTEKKKKKLSGKKEVAKESGTALGKEVKQQKQHR